MKVFDEELALQLAGGNQGLADKMFAMLIEELPILRKQVNRAYADNEEQELLSSAHKLNGSTRYCGVPALKEVAHALEQSIKAGDRSTVDEYILRVNDEIDRLLDLARNPS